MPYRAIFLKNFFGYTFPGKHLRIGVSTDYGPTSESHQHWIPYASVIRHSKCIRNICAKVYCENKTYLRSTQRYRSHDIPYLGGYSNAVPKTRASWAISSAWADRFNTYVGKTKVNFCISNGSDFLGAECRAEFVRGSTWYCFRSNDCRIRNISSLLLEQWIVDLHQRILGVQYWTSLLALRLLNICSIALTDNGSILDIRQSWLSSWSYQMPRVDNTVFSFRR